MIQRSSNSKRLLSGILFCLLLGLFDVTFAQNQNQNNNQKQEAENVKKQVNTCRTDSEKVAILLKQFRKYKDNDFARAAYYSRWMYDSFRKSDHPYVHRTVHFSQGESLLNAEKYDSALICYREAMSYSDEHGKAQCHYRLGKVYERMGNQQEALDHLKIANAQFAKLKSYKNVHGTYDLIIAIYARNGDYGSAIRNIEKKLNLDRSNDNHVKVMEDYIYAASLYGQQNKFNLAFEYLSNALRIAESTKRGFADIYLSIGDLFYQKKNTKMALLYYQKALEKSDLKDPDDILADIYNNIGRVYLDTGRDRVALQYFTEGRTIAKANNFRHSLANSYHYLGNYYQKANQIDLAMNNLKLCYKTGCNECSKLAFFDVLIEIGDLYRLQGNNDLAHEWYLQSLSLAETFNSKRDMSLATLKIGSCFQAENDLPQAERSYLQSVIYARESKQPSALKDIADSLSGFYSVRNDYKKAYEYIRISKILADSISRMDGKANMAALEMNFVFENLKKESDARQALSQEEIKRQKLFRNALFIILSLLIILAALILYGYRKKMKDNKLLVSQKKQIEEKNIEILSQVEEISIQKEEIQRISAKLHETDRMKLRFFSNISHEIRTPLTLIINPLKSVLASFHGNSEEKRQLDLVYDNAARLHELTNQMLDLQKLDSGNLALKTTNDDLVAHLKGIVGAFEGFCQVAQCRLRFSSPYASVYCSFDKDKISKIISNLLSNAFKYNKDGGEVALELAFDAASLTLRVSDTGVGIPAENLNDVFSRYYQMEHLDTRYEGTGIGLAYVKELTTLMNGKIDIRSVVDAGTTVAIHLPMTDLEIVKSEAYSSEIQPKNLTFAFDHSLPDLEKEETYDQTILIVEDNPDLRDMIGRLFMDKCSVVYAGNGLEGAEKAFQYLPDMIISDIMMPLKTGVEMCTLLKKNELTCHIPILLLTAKDSLDSQLQGYESGADDYLVKPFDTDLLKLKVRNIMDTREAIKKRFNFENLNEKTLPQENQMDKEFLRKVVALIEKNMDNPDFSVESLSGQMALSRRSLFRKMKALTNMSPHEFNQAYKMKFAVGLIRKGLRVSEVAYSVGFTNAESFSIAFKKHFGCTPSSYKN